jgi:conjugative transposon TraN protein
MKKIILLYIGIALTITAHTQSFRLEPIPSVTIPVTVDKMTNLVFPEPILSGVKVSSEIIAQKAHGVENVIEIKANHRHFTTTNLTVYGKDGQLYSFILKYVDDTAILNFRILPASGAPIQLSDLPAPIPSLREDAHDLESKSAKLHSSTHTDHLSLGLTGVYSKDSLEWLTFRLTNHSALNFHPETVRFYVQDKKQVRRRAVQEVDITSVYQDQTQTIPSRQSTGLAFAFTPFHIPNTKRLNCELRGKDGRTITLKLKPRRLRINRTSG